jgi:lipopolysaccharide transport system permease protein
MLGSAWMFVNPAAQLLVLTFVFSTLLKAPSEGIPFPVFLFAGLIPWMFFSSAVVSATDSIVGAGGLVTAVYFPRELLVIASVLSRLVDMLAATLIFVVLLVAEGQPVDFTAVWVPVILLFQVVFTVGVSLPLAAVNLYFRDIRFLVAVGLNLWFFLTPVMYPPSIVPDRYRFLYDLNPMARFISAYRGYLFSGSAPSVENMAVATVMALVMVLAGYYVFKKLEPGFADSI